MSQDAEKPDLFSDIVQPDPDDNRRCPGCGTSIADLYTDGRMGCALCYDTFHDIIHRALVVLHGETRHVGKTL